jgi:serine/threonine-protein kinase
VSTRFVLPRDVVLTPAARLDKHLIAQLRPNEGDVAIDRPLARTLPKLVDADSAALLREFSEPHTLAEAIVNLAVARNANAADLVPAAHQALSRFIAAGILAPEGSRLASEIVARLRPADVFEGFRVRDCVRTMSDVELYLAADASGQPVALKIWRDTTDGAREAARHEASMLRTIGGSVAPGLVVDASSADPPHIAMRWCRGVDPDVAADEDERFPPAERQRRRWARACDIAEAYVWLHDQGIVHGDVHEGNVLIDRDGSITLLDFGLAHRVDEAGGPGRGVVFPYLEPEYARADLAGDDEPAATVAGEQYILAALCYRIVAGAHYVDLSPVRADAMRQIVDLPPRPFSACGCIPWPSLEAVLHRALRKTPAERFPSVRAFRDALRAAVPVEVPSRRYRHATGTRARRANGASGVWTKLSDAEAMYDTGYTSAPTCSITYGAAGAALAWYRRSLLTESSEDLSRARHWMRLAEGQRRNAQAFFDGDELTRSTVGSFSIHHGALGVWLTSALIAQAGGDEAGAADAVRAWSAHARSRRKVLDLTLGRAGVLLSAAMLNDALGATTWRCGGTALRYGRQSEAALWKVLDGLGPIADQTEVPNLGIAHGWAGMLYATLRWRASVGARTARDDIVRRRLRELAACAEPWGRGVRWPWRDEPPGPGAFQSYSAGWCNGSAGFVHLWLEAFAAFGDAEYLELAQAAAWHVWEFGDDEVGSLCCGLAGRAYAMLAMFRATSEERWWGWARELARQAAQAAHLDHPESLSLYRGALGVALLLEEMEQPNVARMPAFESDGWAPRA